MADSWTFAVARDDLGQSTLVDGATPEVADGEALLRVDRVGLTANNVTYAVLGDAMRYWEFFPPAARGLGPQWGLAAALGFRRGGRLDGCRCRGGATGLRLPASRGAPRGAAGPGGRVRVPRREPAPGRAAVAVQRVPVDHRRPGVPGRPGGPADPVPAAVLHLVHAGRPGRRQRLLRCRGAAGVVGVEQDRVRRRVRAARSRAAPGRAHLTRQPGLHPVTRLLRRGRVRTTTSAPSTWSRPSTSTCPARPRPVPPCAQHLGDRLVRDIAVGLTNQTPNADAAGGGVLRAGPDAQARPATGAAKGSTSGSPRPGSASPQWSAGGSTSRWAPGRRPCNEAWLDVLAGRTPPRVGHVVQL